MNMKRRLVIAVTGFMLLGLSASAFATPATPVLPAAAAMGPRHGIYGDASSYQQAVDAAKALFPAANLSDKALEARHAAIGKALDQVVLGNANQDKVAEKFGLIIYDPNLNSIGIMSSQPNDVSIPAVQVIFDSLSGEVGFQGQATWTDSYALDQDSGWKLGYVGGYDGVALEFSNVVDPTNVYSYSFTTYYRNGNQSSYSTTRSGSPQSGTKLGIAFMGQDSMTTPSGYSWWNMIERVWFRSTWSDHGNVVFTYGHDWNSTKLTAIDYNVSGGTQAAGTSLTYHWSVGTDYWPQIASPWTGY